MEVCNLLTKLLLSVCIRYDFDKALEGAEGVTGTQLLYAGFLVVFTPKRNK